MTHFGRLGVIVSIIRTDPTKTEELTEWNGVPAVSGVVGSILEVVVSVCGFVVNGSGYSVVGNRNTKVQEWYRGLAYLKSILKSRMIG